jgi:DNA-binding NarL/FixJ family response regulator
MAGKVVGSFVNKSLHSALRGEIEGAPLSERESEVLRLIAQGYTNKEIAVQLSLSVKTVETYKARSMEKLGLSSRAETVRYALEQGWLTGD